MNFITLSDLAKHFGTTVDKFSNEIKELHKSMDLSYEAIWGDQRDDLILDILKRSDMDKQKIGAPERAAVWLRGWGENLEDFRNSGDLEDITPKFIRPQSVVRLNQRYVTPSDVFFEKNFVKLIQRYIFDEYAAKYKNVYEFGCGSGFNLVSLAQWYPQKILRGTDFVQSSIDLINDIAEKQGYNLTGELFDMLEPNDDYKLEQDSCVFTFGAIEQLASKFEKFVDYLIANKPEMCFHIEPTVEFYRQDILEDYLASRFQNKRGYTSGFVPHLLELESQNKVEILKLHRMNFGSKFIEGYNLIVWKPV